MKAIAAAFSLIALTNYGVTSAAAQTYSTYVTDFGENTNDCSATMQGAGTVGPCKSLSVAMNKTSEGGKIVCVGPVVSSGIVNVTKAVTIECSLGGGANATTFIIDAAGKRVRLVNVGIHGTGLASWGVDIKEAASVHIENVKITENISGGIRDVRPASGKLFIKDTSILNANGPGIVIAPQSGANVSAVLDNVAVRDTTYGLAVGIGGRAMVNRSVFSGNSVAGIEADPGAIIDIEDTLTSGNGNGVQASPGATVAISNARINSNNTAISGATRSYGNNKLFANIADGTAPTPVGVTSSENGLR